VEVKESKCGIEIKCVLVAPGLPSFNGIKSMYVAQACLFHWNYPKKIFILSVTCRAADKLLHSAYDLFFLIVKLIVILIMA
jgi:hypothetical protein